ncbi:hypothetical protein FFI89_007205 [Bradyrhizobium sp. KBS0727]|uniref:hypothetical protein n=1 Tax=unclassified Bradyrhizobium TaxID=2631580 RepID=UPI00110DF879|nr:MULTISPECIES: hypothetical protein [unclassified Bradyrhizobium]QDW36943.1 hypothetical protein FFI71_007205 [Bradyrhizobium sp. KBS0725]QDW43543.1 hypothetical protein FFI89_007205 [Bradyrhizobium sp. KBS0727]
MKAKRWVERTGAFDLRTAYFALLALMTLPALFLIPRTADLVNHWARLTILTMPASDPLNTFYLVQWGAYPNLGLDLIYIALAPLLGAEMVVRLAFILAFWLPALGVWALHRVWAQEPSPTILIAPILSYNLVTTVGLVNYGLGMGFALIALAWWAAHERRRVLYDLLVVNAVAIALFFCHLMALASFCIIFGFLEATPHQGEPLKVAFLRALRSPLHVAAAVALVWSMPQLPHGYELTGAKFWIFVAPFYSGLPLDLQWGVGLAALILALFAVRFIVIAEPARFAVFGFFVVAACAPSSMGTANLVDARLVVLWAYLALGATVARVPKPKHLVGFVSIAVFAFALARLALLIPVWSAYNEDVVELRAALSAIPPGSSVLAVAPPNCPDPNLNFEYNLSTFAVIDRRAQVNTLFAGQGLQPVRARDAAIAAAPQAIVNSEWLSGTSGQLKLKADAPAAWANVISHWRDRFDVVVDLHGTCESAIAAPGLERVARSKIADIYIAERPKR